MYALFRCATPNLYTIGYGNCGAMVGQLLDQGEGPDVIWEYDLVFILRKFVVSSRVLRFTLLLVGSKIKS